MRSYVHVFKCKKCQASLQFTPGAGRAIKTNLAVYETKPYPRLHPPSHYRTCKEQIMCKALQ